MATVFGDLSGYTLTGDVINAPSNSSFNVPSPLYAFYVALNTSSAPLAGGLLGSGLHSVPSGETWVVFLARIIPTINAL